MTDLRAAACLLVEAAAEIRRDGNTDERMENLARAMNAVLRLVGEGDAATYSKEAGAFGVVSGFEPYSAISIARRIMRGDSLGTSVPHLKKRGPKPKNR